VRYRRYYYRKNRNGSVDVVRVGALARGVWWGVGLVVLIAGIHTLIEYPLWLVFFAALFYLGYLGNKMEKGKK
jgi:hypothetical protein